MREWGGRLCKNKKRKNTSLYWKKTHGSTHRPPFARTLRREDTKSFQAVDSNSNDSRRKNARIQSARAPQQRMLLVRHAPHHASCAQGKSNSWGERFAFFYSRGTFLPFLSIILPTIAKLLSAGNTFYRQKPRWSICSCSSNQKSERLPTNVKPIRSNTCQKYDGWISLPHIFSCLPYLSPAVCDFHE